MIRKIAEHHENEFGYIVYKDNDFKEYMVKFFKNGEEIPGRNYYTDDEKDAVATAKTQLNYLIVRA